MSTAKMADFPATMSRLGGKKWVKPRHVPKDAPYDKAIFKETEWMARWLANHYFQQVGRKSHVTYDIIESYALSGLWRACQRKDPNIGVGKGWRTFAKSWIVQGIQRGIHGEISAVQFSKHCNTRFPTGMCLSLNRAKYTDEKGSTVEYQDLLPDESESIEEALSADELKSELGKAMAACLSEREITALTCRFTEGENLRTAGDKLGVSRERARQLYERAKRKLSRYLENHRPDLAEIGRSC